MLALEQIRALYEYNEWANGHVLDAASNLSEEELAQEQGASFGNVQGNLWHLVWAQAIWLARWTGSKPVERLEPEQGRAVQMIREAYQTSHESLRSFVASLAEHDLPRVLSYTDSRGDAQQAVLWKTMLHVVNHGTHHRAETALLLTTLGNPPRQLDYAFFELEREGAPPRLT